jgi:hypothetical protein
LSCPPKFSEGKNKGQKCVLNDEESKKAKTMKGKLKMKNRNMIYGVVLSVFTCFAFLPQMEAVPDEGPSLPENFSGSNTFDGFHALVNQTANSFNSAFGWQSLATQTTATAVTGCGAGTLVFNTADNNTAVGAAALEFNTSGTQNIALGGFAMLNNVTGSENTAVGFGAMQNATGSSVVFNTAVGIQALMNTTANANTAVGDFALQNDSGASSTQLLVRSPAAIKRLAAEMSISARGSQVSPGRTIIPISKMLTPRP